VIYQTGHNVLTTLLHLSIYDLSYHYYDLQNNSNYCLFLVIHEDAKTYPN